MPRGANDPKALKSKQKENLVQYAQKVEDDMYCTAASKVCRILILCHSSIYIFYTFD